MSKAIYPEIKITKINSDEITYQSSIRIKRNGGWYDLLSDTERVNNIKNGIKLL